MSGNRAPTVAISIFLALIVCGVGYYAYRSYQTSHHLVTDSDAARTLANPTEAYTAFDGKTVDMNSFAGRPIVVTSFASWSPESATNLQILEKLAQSSDYQDAAFVAINRREDPLLAKKYLSTLGALEHLIFVLDSSDSFYENIEGYAMPETLFYSRAGVILEHHRGLLNEADTQAFIVRITSE